MEATRLKISTIKLKPQTWQKTRLVNTKSNNLLI